MPNINIKIDEKTKRDVDIKVAKERTTITAVVINALKEWLGKKKEGAS
jgi:hypothetical protein